MPSNRVIKHLFIICACMLFCGLYTTVPWQRVVLYVFILLLFATVACWWLWCSITVDMWTVLFSTSFFHLMIGMVFMYKNKAFHFIQFNWFTAGKVTSFLGCIECMRCSLLLPMCVVFVRQSVCHTAQVSFIVQKRLNRSRCCLGWTLLEPRVHCVTRGSWSLHRWGGGPTFRVCEIVQTLKQFSRTCKDQIPGFSRTQITRFQGLSSIHSVHKHGCMRSKSAHTKSVRCNCTTLNKPQRNTCGCINVLQWTQNSPASLVTGSRLIDNLHQIQYLLSSERYLNQ